MDTIRTHAALIADGLSLSITSEDLKEMFTPYGRVIWTRVVMDQFRRSMSYGYVVMATHAEADRAIQALDMQFRNERILRVVRTEIPPLPHAV